MSQTSEAFLRLINRMCSWMIFFTSIFCSYKPNIYMNNIMMNNNEFTDTKWIQSSSFLINQSIFCLSFYLESSALELWRYKR